MISEVDYIRAYRSGFQRVVKMLSRMGYPQISEDIAQTAWTKAWEKREGFRGGSSILTWVSAIAKHELWSRGRKVQEEQWPETLRPAVFPDYNNRLDLERILSMCTLQTRRMLRLELYGETLHAIAEQEHQTYAALKKRVFVAHHALRSRYAA